MARPGSGKGKGREERKPEGLEAHMVGGGALIFPDPPWLVLPALALAKSFSQRCPKVGALGYYRVASRACARGSQGVRGGGASGWRPRGARKGRLGF